MAKYRCIIPKLVFVQVVMGDETPNTMNLDLNLGPFPALVNGASSDSLSVNLEDWIGGRTNQVREAVRLRARNHWRSVWRQVPLPPPQEETRNVALELLETGEGSVPADERIKKCDNNAIHLNSDELSKKDDDHQKASRDEGSFFDCNICLDLSKNPVVTCCGHLFCWTCLYRWLHLHSEAKECPVCKGEVTTKMVTPIYGRNSSNSLDLEDDLTLKIPSRPQAHRVESWRQTIQRNNYPFPVEEMIRQLGNTFDMTRDMVEVHPQEIDHHPPRSPPERNSSLLNRLLTSRGLLREQNVVAIPNEVVDQRESSPSNFEMADSRRLSLRRPHAHRAAAANIVSSVLFSSYAQRLSQPMVRHPHPIERNQDQQQQQQPISTDDRDSVSSIAAVIHSESHTLDNAVEIDSAVSFSTSSSRRRNDGGWVSTEMDSGDSRPPRRRRMN